jgi:ubiquitin-conjugating enzyme E2 C
MATMITGDITISAFLNQSTFQIDRDHAWNSCQCIWRSKGLNSLEFPSANPFKYTHSETPQICYHCNGNIWLDVTRNEWSALYDVRSNMLSIQSLLREPNIYSSLNTCFAELWGKKKTPTAFKKYLQETYSKSVSHQEPWPELSSISLM